MIYVEPSPKPVPRVAKLDTLRLARQTQTRKYIQVRHEAVVSGRAIRTRRRAERNGLLQWECETDQSCAELNIQQRETMPDAPQTHSSTTDYRWFMSNLATTRWDEYEPVDDVERMGTMQISLLRTASVQTRRGRRAGATPVLRRR